MDLGARLGRYELRDLIGRGGMGEVYRARDTRLDRVVAVKTLAPRLAADAVARARFEREARAVAALSHPNILAIYDVGDADGVLFVVTELLEGATLRTRLLAGPLAPEIARDYAQQLARGLAAAHAKGILHRDLKPANAFVAQDGRVKILDFGLAMMTSARESSGEAETIADAHTNPGVMLGTPAYMSPEQMRDSDVDHRTDLFALGAVLYEMISGAPPFDGRSVADIVSAVLTTEPRHLPARSPLGAALERIARRCLAKDPAQRFQSAEEIIGALTAAEAEPAAATTPTTAPRSSIAVLPFADLSADHSLGYLCDGIAEEITSGLARLPGLRVAAHTSAFQFRGQAGDVRRIGEALGSEAVLEGSVRGAGTRLRVVAHLINAADGYQIWTERFDREAGDVFALEDDIASAVVSALRGRFAGAAGGLASSLAGGGLLARGTADVDAYTLYLKGRHQWNTRTEDSLRTAAALFQSAIDRDPAFAQAFGALADVLVTLGLYGAAPPADVMPKARTAAHRALDLAPTVPIVAAGASTSLGTIAAVFDWNWGEADRLFANAIAADPDYPTAHHWRAMNCLLPQRRTAEADAALARAAALDPVSPIIGVSLGLASFFARRYDDAVRQFESVIALDAHFAMAHFFLGQTFAAQGRYDRAIQSLETALALAGGSPEVRASLGHAHAAAGHDAPARQALADSRIARVVALRVSRARGSRPRRARGSAGGDRGARAGGLGARRRPGLARHAAGVRPGADRRTVPGAVPTGRRRVARRAAASQPLPRSRRPTTAPGDA